MAKMSSMKPVAKSAGKPRTAPKKQPPVMGASERKWRAEDAMRDIMRAEEHKKDRALMADVKKLAKEQASKLNGLCGKGK